MTQMKECGKKWLRLSVKQHQNISVLFLIRYYKLLQMVQFNLTVVFNIHVSHGYYACCNWSV